MTGHPGVIILTFLGECLRSKSRSQDSDSSKRGQQTCRLLCLLDMSKTIPVHSPVVQAVLVQAVVVLLSGFDSPTLFCLSFLIREENVWNDFNTI